MAHYRFDNHTALRFLQIRQEIQCENNIDLMHDGVTQIVNERRSGVTLMRKKLLAAA